MITSQLPDDRLPVITIFNGQAVTSSFEVSRVFHKEHSKLINKINNINCSKDFIEYNIIFDNDHFLLTKNGLLILCINYNDQQAMLSKKIYVQEFDKVEQKIAAAHHNFINFLSDSRFIMSINENLEVAFQPLANGSGIINPNNKAQVLELFRTAIPSSFIPDLIREGVNRLE